MRERKIRTADVIRAVVLIIALSVLLYPTVSSYFNAKNSSTIASDYDQSVNSMTSEEKQKMWDEAVAYNQTLVGNTSFRDPFTETDGEENEVYESLLNIDGNGMMGYIRIPKIDVMLPIYHGTEEKVLQVAAGHISTSSLPVGGESTHSVLTGHRGLPSARLFTDLDQLAQGDVFYLHILDHKLAYQVDQILTVLPTETEALEIIEGEDLCTLVTCTPYAVNTHRLLIRGHRIPYVEATKTVPDETDGFYVPFEILMLLIALVLLLIILIMWRIIVWRKKKRCRRKKRNRRKRR